MSSLLSFTIIGLFTGAAYAIAASGLVLTYTTTRVFNIAHGAFGMVLAFTFWDFSQRQGMPLWLALFLVLGVVAPAIGWFIQRFVTRGLGEGPVSVALVVTVGLFVGCIGVAQQIWPPAARTVPQFMPERGLTVAGTYVTAHQIITILLSMVVAGLLYLLLNRTRIGTAMRASVDNPELLKLFGGRPDLVASLSWAIGISLAALAGILLTPYIGLNYYDLTLLVINAYAAAMLGKLKSLPLTFVGAMGLGILQSFAVAYMPSEGPLSGVRAVVPALFLFAVIVLMPQAQLRIGQVKGIVSAPQPSTRQALGWGVALLLLVALLTTSLSTVNLLLVGTAATYAMVMLSLVLLTGYGGHVSLAQFTFAGVGALAYAKLDSPNLFGLLMAALIAAGVGALVALPVLRLTGLYLALSTLAFGVLMDKMIFQADYAFGYNGTLPAGRLSVLGKAIDSTGAYVLVMTLFLVAMAWGLLLLRRGTIGRLLIAMRDSPAACTTLGLNMRWFRVGSLRALCRDGRSRRCSLRRSARHDRRQRLPVLQQPAVAAARRGLRSHLRDRRDAGRHRPDAAACRAELPSRDRRPDLRDPRIRSGGPGPRPERPGQPALQARSAAGSSDFGTRVRASVPMMSRNPAPPDGVEHDDEQQEVSAHVAP